MLRENRGMDVEQVKSTPVLPIGEEYSWKKS
jgi:hypothetical protein